MSDRFIGLLEAYFREFPEETDLRRRFFDLLRRPDAFHRTCRPGHFTASALILDPSRSRTLLVEHRKLGFWVQPGGHADGSTDLADAAGREVNEETGLERWQCDGSILDVDIHPIPARPGESAHDHYDVRFLFVADPSDPVAISHESTDLKWIATTSIRDYTEEESMLRMLRKSGAEGFSD